MDENIKINNKLINNNMFSIIQIQNRKLLRWSEKKSILLPTYSSEIKTKIELYIYNLDVSLTISRCFWVFAKIGLFKIFNPWIFPRFALYLNTKRQRYKRWTNPSIIYLFLVCHLMLFLASNLFFMLSTI